jgi:hypothetical protein
MHPSLRVSSQLAVTVVSVVSVSASAGGRRPRRCMSVLVLYQWTQAEVMSSRSARVVIGPMRKGESLRAHSVL